MTPDLPAPAGPAFYRRQGPLGRTLLEALGLLAVNLVLGALIGLLGLPLVPSQENVEGLEGLRALGPLVLLAFGVLILPPLEELVFRGVPLGLLRLLGGGRVLFWLLGLLGAALFALAHALTLEPGGSALAVSGFPLPQFVLGLWSWRVATSRGLGYSVVLHMAYNLVPILLLLVSGQAAV